MKKVTKSSVKKRTTVNKNAKQSQAFVTFGAPLKSGKDIPSPKELEDIVNKIDPNCLDKTNDVCENGDSTDERGRTPDHLIKPYKGKNCTSQKGELGTHSKECMEDHDKASCIHKGSTIGVEGDSSFLECPTCGYRKYFTLS